MQKVMNCTTRRGSMRATIESWTFEDGDMVVAGKMIMLFMTLSYMRSETAGGCSDRLRKFTDSVGKGWEWWLVRE